MAILGLRLRGVLEDNLSVIVVVLVLFTLGGGYVTYATHIDPGVQTETRQLSEWSSQGEFIHQATISYGTAAFEEGTVLRNRPAYFLAIAPVLNGSGVYSYTASEGGQLQVAGTLTLVIRSGSGDESEARSEYWRIEESLQTTTDEALEPGESVTLPYSINVSRMAARAEAIDSQLGGTPGDIQLQLRAAFDLSGSRNGQSVDRTNEYVANLTTNGNVYSLQGADPTTMSGQQTGTVSVPATYGPLRSIGGPLLLAIGLLGLLAVGVLSRQKSLSLSDIEREWLAYRSARKEFSEWITVGRVPDDALPPKRVPIDTLEGLVDIAIDSDRRVIRDRDRDTYFVTVEDIAYTYSPPAEPSRSTGQDPLSGDESGSGTIPLLQSDASEEADEAAGTEESEDAGSSEELSEG